MKFDKNTKKNVRKQTTIFYTNHAIQNFNIAKLNYDRKIFILCCVLWLYKKLALLAWRSDLQLWIIQIPDNTTLCHFSCFYLATHCLLWHYRPFVINVRKEIYCKRTLLVRVAELSEQYTNKLDLSIIYNHKLIQHRMWSIHSQNRLINRNLFLQFDCWHTIFSHHKPLR